MEVTLALDGNAVRREALRQVMLRIRERMLDLRPCFDEILNAVYAHEEQLFRQEGATLDEPRWDDLSESYRTWKDRHAPGMPILQLSQKLRRQLTGEGGALITRQPRWLLIETDVPLGWGSVNRAQGRSTAVYPMDLGALHMTGRRAGGAPEMPARPPIRTSDAEAMDVTDVLADYLTDSRITR